MTQNESEMSQNELISVVGVFWTRLILIKKRSIPSGGGANTPLEPFGVANYIETRTPLPNFRHFCAFLTFWWELRRNRVIQAADCAASTT